MSTSLRTDEACPKPGAMREFVSLLAIAVVWLSVAVLLAQRGVFRAPLNLAMAALGPATVFVVVYLLSPRLRDWVRRVDMAVIVNAQAWRVVGALFLPLWAFGILPGGFAGPAAIGDIAIGVAAPFVALAVVRQARSWRASVMVLSLVGMLDFAIVFTAAALAAPGGPLAAADGISSSVMGHLPLSVIPTLLVPVFLILHVVALLKLGARG